MLNLTLDAVQTKKCEVEVFGLGYVGFPLAVRLASGGFHVTGIDINQDRISRLKNNQLMDTELRFKNEFLNSRNEKKLDFSIKSLKSELSKEMCGL